MATMAPERSAAGILHDVRNLVARIQHGEVFRHYLARRKVRVALLVILCALLSVACASGVIAFVLGSRPILVLMAVLASPFVLLGSLLLLLYGLFSWLENLALARALPRAHPDRAALPHLPWGATTALVFIPFVLLVVRNPAIGLPLAAIAAAAPFLYLRFERQKR